MESDTTIVSSAQLETSKPKISPSMFHALDLRVGRVLTAEPFPEARKPAWKLAIDFGAKLGTMRASAQITNYRPDELAGRLIVAAINLGMKQVANFRSECLVLGAVHSDGHVTLLTVEADVEPGTPIA